MEENKSFFISAGLFFITLLGTGAVSFFYGQSSAEIIRNCTAAGMGAGMVVFLMAQAKESGLYEYDNASYCGRFFLCFLAGMIAAFACAKLPAGGWPFVPLFVLLALFSNSLIGICAGTCLLMLSVLLSGAGIGIFFLYFISGIASVCVFGHLDENYKVGVPVVVSLIVLIVSLTAEIVLFENAKLSVDLFLIPLMNVVLTFLLLLVILKLFSYLVIYKYRERYMEINDPECPLLVQLKSKSREEYYKAVHTAYLSDKIAKKLKLDDKVAKAGGYYHRIGCLNGENNWENVKNIGTEYQFPPEVLAVLQEYLEKGNKIIKKETAVLYFADAVVNSILFMLAKSSDEKLDYDQIIDAVFKKKQESTSFQECLLSISELNQMKKIFKEEKLYYDFLR